MIQKRERQKFPIRKAISAWIILWFGVGNIALFTAFIMGHKVYEPSQLIASIELGLACLGLLWFLQYLKRG